MNTIFFQRNTQKYNMWRVALWCGVWEMGQQILDRVHMAGFGGFWMVGASCFFILKKEVAEKRKTMPKLLGFTIDHAVYA